MKDIILRIKKIESVQKTRRDKNRLARYNLVTVHRKQMEFHRCTKRNRWVFGGNRSGKTECGAVESVWRARGIHPYRQNRDGVVGWVVSPTLAVSREVAQSKILYYLNPDWIEDVVMQSGKASSPAGGVIDYIAIKNVFGGISRICFKSAEMGREKFQGASLDFVWFDEEPPKDIYDECRMRVLDKKGDIYGTMTPLLGLTFTYNEIYLNESGDDDVWHIFMEWADNPFLDKGEVDKLTASLSRDLLEQRRYGRFINSRGLVYPEFDENINVIQPFTVPKEWYDMISIDPGLNNPTSCHFYATDGDGNVYVIAEHYAKGINIDAHAAAIHLIAKDLDWHTDSFGRLPALIDSAANQKTLSGTKSVCELFCDLGINASPKVNKDLFSGISRVKQYLSGVNGRLYIFSCCVNLIREIKSYWWGDGDVPKKKDDHALDELRYYLMSRPEPYKPPVTLSEIQRDKARLYKQLRNKAKL